jgi:hypothetical protein
MEREKKRREGKKKGEEEKRSYKSTRVTLLN